MAGNDHVIDIFTSKHCIYLKSRDHKSANHGLAFPLAIQQKELLS